MSVDSEHSAHRRRSPVLSGWAAISPYGLGAEAFRDGLAAGRVALGPVPEHLREDSPQETGGIVPAFDAKQVLRRKGTRSLDRLTALAVATVGLLLESAGTGLAEDEPEGLGLVFGTGHGSVKTIMDFTGQSFTGARPYHVDPALIPLGVLNSAAGRSAIWHGIKGPNTTVSGGAPTALLAATYAARLLRQGRAEAMLMGVVEEYSAQRAWLEHHSRAEGDRQADGPLGEGGAVLLLESAERAARHGRPVLARPLAARFTAFPAVADAGAALARAVTEALMAADAVPEQITRVIPGDLGGLLGEQEDKALAAALGAHRPAETRLRPLIGDACSAAGVFQFAAALADSEPGLTLLTSLDPEGTAACTLVAGPAVSG
jgi:3-oxoacyl-[acyl-carrier-protein] synthase II